MGSPRWVVSPFEETKEREREIQEKAPLAVLLEGGFIPMEEELVCTFRLTSVVTSGVAESYGEPTGVVVWDEDVVRHAVLMAYGGGVGWRSVRTLPPRMLNLSLTWSPGPT
ncbi:hypothetical protein B296_00027116 [Ensete ventricosum]|uniref:Uncharacterized protein n=1 Tax=Ensete ventricosum TaxID=4639 RepID=A0A426YE97_ENSVE|nr:hypothetical protein B296_00027116 [Ensete ventricosum]